MNDRSALNSLMDFRDLTKQKATLKHVNSEETGEESTDNELILRSFEELKKKLRIVQKDNALLKEEQKISGIRLRQNQ